MTSPTLLVIEDDRQIRLAVAESVRAHGMSIVEAETGAAGVTAAESPDVDLIILDLGLPDIDGLIVCQQIRTRSTVPIIVLTARDSESETVALLNAGADDYITKPFSTRELLARIKALLRRSAPQTVDTRVEISGLQLDPITHRVQANGRKIDLGPMEFKLLHFFMTHTERVHSRERILDSVWGGNVYVEERTVDVHIRRLRKALTLTGHDALIQTVRGSGYRLSIQT